MKAEAKKPSKNEGEFSPLPLVKSKDSSSNAFEPMLPTQSSSKVTQADLFDSESLEENASPTKPETKTSESEQAAAPPPRLSRMSGPQLLRRPRGNQGPRESFKPK